MWVEHGRGIGMDWEGLEWGCSNIELLSLVKGWEISLAYATQRALWTPSGRFHAHRAASIKYHPPSTHGLGHIERGAGRSVVSSPPPIKINSLNSCSVGAMRVYMGIQVADQQAPGMNGQVDHRCVNSLC